MASSKKFSKSESISVQLAETLRSQLFNSNGLSKDLADEARKITLPPYSSAEYLWVVIRDLGGPRVWPLGR